LEKFQDFTNWGIASDLLNMIAAMGWVDQVLEGF